MNRLVPLVVVRPGAQTDDDPVTAPVTIGNLGSPVPSVLKPLADLVPADAAEPPAATPAAPAGPVAQVLRLLADPFYRNSLYLILNYAFAGILGFTFWAFAARSFPAAEVGGASALFSALTFISTAAGLGFQATVVRYLGDEPDQRRYLIASSVLVGLVALVITTIVLVVPGRLGLPVPSSDGLRVPIVVVVLTVLLAVGTVADAAMIGFRSTGPIVVKNIVAGGVRLALIPLATGHGESGLLLCMLVGAGLATAASSVLSYLKASSTIRRKHYETLRGKVKFAAANHAATLLSMAPLALLPTFAVNVLGAAQGAYLGSSLLIVMALNAVPTVVSQSLFAELSARSADATRLVARAFRATYAFTIPIAGVLLVIAPFVLGMFGPAYTAADGCLRLMGVGVIFGSFNYVADVVLNVAGRIRAFTVVNVSGAVIVTTLSMLGTPYGLTLLGAGWLAGQACYSLIATAALVSSRILTLPRMHITLPSH